MFRQYLHISPIQEVYASTYIDVRSNYIFGGPNVIYTVITAICAACMNINNVSPPPPPAPPGSYAYDIVLSTNPFMFIL